MQDLLTGEEYVNYNSNEAVKVLATGLSNGTETQTTPGPHVTTYRPPHPTNPGRVLCTVLVTVLWAGSPSFIEFHSIDN